MLGLFQAQKRCVMKICPSCKEEYVDRMEVCPECEQKLVAEHEIVNEPASDLKKSKENLLKSETMPLIEGALNTCRELEGVLSEAKIESAIYPLKLGGDDNAATIGSASALKYMLLVRVEDIERCKQLLENRFYDQVMREGKGEYVHDAVDLSADEICCPACKERGSLKMGECQFCGLFLG